jgi:hypothetical protein
LEDAQFASMPAYTRPAAEGAAPSSAEGQIGARRGPIRKNPDGLDRQFQRKERRSPSQFIEDIDYDDPIPDHPPATQKDDE